MCVFALKGFKEERLRGFACCQLSAEHSRQYWWELQLEAGNTGAKLRRRGTEPCLLHPSVCDPWQSQFSRACWPQKRMSFPSS